MPLRTHKRVQAPKETTSKAPRPSFWRASPLEALFYLAAGAYVWQVGVWAFRGVRGNPELPVELPRRQLVPPMARVTSSSLLREPEREPGTRPVAPDAPNLGGSGAKPPPEPAEPGAEVSDRFSMLEIDE